MNIFTKIVLSALIFSMTTLSAQEAPIAALRGGKVKKAQKYITTATANSGRHQTLWTLIQETEFATLLNRPGSFTVFAPSDIAFKNLVGTSVADLLHADNREELENLLGYHIVAGKLSASKILKALGRGDGIATFTTVQGDVITATMKGIDIVLSDSYGNVATIVLADSNQGNGIIHEIDGVIKPVKI